jgi:hypothetical protein
MSLLESSSTSAAARCEPAAAHDHAAVELRPPQVVGCGFDPAFQTSPAVMRLRWSGGLPSRRAWNLPGGVCVSGPPPENFGITVRRQADDTYYVDLLWDRMFLCWASLTRGQLVESALLPLLRILGTELSELLDQPLERES